MKIIVVVVDSDDGNVCGSLESDDGKGCRGGVVVEESYDGNGSRVDGHDSVGE